MQSTAREQWGVALRHIPLDELRSIVDGLVAGLQVKPKTLPQAGLALLTIRESTQQQPFYLGEFPLTSVTVMMIDGAGRQYEGAALLMDDDVTRAECLAVCDGILANRLHGWETIAECIQRGQHTLDDIAAQRDLILHRTRVDFSLLEDVGGSDA